MLEDNIYCWRKKNQRLKNAHQTLSHRIEIVHSKLLEQHHQYQGESVQMLSSTVAKIISIKSVKKFCTVPQQIIEINMLKKIAGSHCCSSERNKASVSIQINN